MGETMRNKILTFSCILLTGMMLCSGTKIVRADDAVSTEAAIELKTDEAKAINKDETKEEVKEEVEVEVEVKEEVEVEDVEEVEVDDDDTPLSSTDNKDKTSNKNKVKKTDKKSKKTGKKVKSVIKYTEEEFKILVCVTFLEAGNQPYKGKLATANAVINRVLSNKFPNSIKSVVYQKYAGRYQFALCAPGGKLEQAMKNYGKNTGWRADFEKACIKVCKDALAGKTATDKRYHFFRLYYKGIEGWKSDGVKIGATYFYNY